MVWVAETCCEYVFSVHLTRASIPSAHDFMLIESRYLSRGQGRGQGRGWGQGRGQGQDWGQDETARGFVWIGRWYRYNATG